jgi:hypothetical protein
VNFFLDNCLPPDWAPALTALARGDRRSIEHLRDRFPPDAADVDWIPQLAAHGQYVIISGDERITRNPHERAIWKQAKLTSFFLARGWSHLKMWDKTWMFIRWFPKLAEQAKLVAPGAGFLVPVQYGENKLKQI